MKNQSFTDLIRRFIRNETSYEENQRLLTQLQSEAYDNEIKEALNEVEWEEPELEDQVNESERFDRISLRLKERMEYPQKRKRRLFLSAIKVAAVFIGILLFSVWIYNSPVSNLTVVSTAYGETKTIILPDKSVVIINGNSQLKYQEDMDKGSERKVWLKGEAFFSVTHTLNHDRFVVNTSKNMRVEVLGTEFNVSNRKSGTKVSLNSGKIKLHLLTTLGKESDSEIFLKPGELIEFKGESPSYSKKLVNPKIYSSWKDKKLIFDNTRLAEIVGLLEETYGIKARISDPTLLDKKIVGSIPSANLDVFLKILSKSLNLQITRSNKEVFIKKNTF